MFREGKWFGGPTTFGEDAFWVHLVDAKAYANDAKILFRAVCKSVAGEMPHML